MRKLTSISQKNWITFESWLFYNYILISKKYPMGTLRYINIFLCCGVDAYGHLLAQNESDTTRFEVGSLCYLCLTPPPVTFQLICGNQTLLGGCQAVYKEITFENPSHE